MRRDSLLTLVETHIDEHNGNVEEGRKSFVSQMNRLIVNEGVTLESVTIDNLWEAMVERHEAIDKDNSVAVCETMMAAGMPTLVGKLLHPVFMKAYTPLTESVLQLVSEVPTKRMKETIGGLSAHDNLQLTREGTPYQASQPSEKEAEIENRKFGILIDLTAEAVTSDQTGQIVKRARDIGIKAGTHIHSYIIQKVCDLPVDVTGEAVETSLVINGTARAMYADTHAAWDNGQVNDNLGATALGATGLTACRLLLAGMNDEKGDKVVILPRFLIVPAALEVMALKLIGSDKEIGSGYNDINVFYKAYTVVSSPILDSDTILAYWLGDPTMQTQIQWYWKPKTDSMGGNTQKAFDSDIVAQYKISYFAGVGSTDYRYVAQGNALT